MAFVFGTTISRMVSTVLCSPQTTSYFSLFLTKSRTVTTEGLNPLENGICNIRPHLCYISTDCPKSCFDPVECRPGWRLGNINLEGPSRPRTLEINSLRTHSTGDDFPSLRWLAGSKEDWRGWISRPTAPTGDDLGGRLPVKRLPAWRFPEVVRWCEMFGWWYHGQAYAWITRRASLAQIFLFPLNCRDKTPFHNLTCFSMFKIRNN